jgi:hypothetical protein
MGAWGCRRYLFSWEQGQVADSCKRSNESTGSIKGGISWQAKQLLASQEGLMELVIYVQVNHNSYLQPYAYSCFIWKSYGNDWYACHFIGVRYGLVVFLDE